MKHVYVITHGMLTIGVTRKRKGIRKIIDRDYLAHEERPLVWRKSDWAPFLKSSTPGGVATGPYRVEKFGVQ